MKSFIVVSAVTGGLLVSALVAMPATAARPTDYPPAPSPTATATPAPSPTPTPTPTPAPTPKPTPVPNGPFNPPNPVKPVEVARTVVVVSFGTALQTRPRFYVYKASTSLANAPQADRRVNGQYVPIYRVGQVVRLVARVPANTTFDMKLKVNGKYVDLGVGRSDANGRISMTAFRVTRAQSFVYAFVDTKTGKTYYVKINVSGPRADQGTAYEKSRTP